MEPILNQAIYSALRAALGDASIPIRQAYQNPVPPPPGNDGNILYYHLVPDSSSPWTETSTALEGDTVFFRFAAFRLMLTFYGPQVEELAWRVFHRLFLDGYQQPRWFLRGAGIYPLPHAQGPTLVWEEWEKEHRSRADLVVPLRIRGQEILSPEQIGMVDYPPDILLNR